MLALPAPALPGRCPGRRPPVRVSGLLQRVQGVGCEVFKFPRSDFEMLILVGELDPGTAPSYVLMSVLHLALELGDADSMCNRA